MKTNQLIHLCSRLILKSMRRHNLQFDFNKNRLLMNVISNNEDEILDLLKQDIVDKALKLENLSKLKKKQL